MPIGPIEVAVAVVIVLLIAGPNRVMRLGSRLTGSVRRSVREFRDAASDPADGSRGA